LSRVAGLIEHSQFPIRLVLNGKASKEIEWHCKHYVGRGLMKRFDTGEALAKEMGITPSVLKKTFDDYNTSARTKKDPYGKKVPLLAITDADVILICCYSLSSSLTANGH
jgi:hypothetical protein